MIEGYGIAMQGLHRKYIFFWVINGFLQLTHFYKGKFCSLTPLPTEGRCSASVLHQP